MWEEKDGIKTTEGKGHFQVSGAEAGGLLQIQSQAWVYSETLSI